MATYNQIISQLNQIANNHQLINTFGEGDIWEISTSGDIMYPLMWVTTENAQISKATKSKILNFSIYFMDVVKNGEINEREVLSDQLSIAEDVLAQLNHPNYEWSFADNTSTLEDFTERFTDSVAGWKATISLKLPYSSNRCVMPYEGNTNPSTGGGGGSAAGTINVYLDGVLQSTTSSTNLNAETVNILWT